MTDTFSAAVLAMNNLNAKFYRHKVHNTLIRATQITAVEGLSCYLGGGNAVVVDSFDDPKVGDYLAVNLSRNRYAIYDQVLFFQTYEEKEDPRIDRFLSAYQTKDGQWRYTGKKDNRFVQDIILEFRKRTGSPSEDLISITAEKHRHDGLVEIAQIEAIGFPPIFAINHGIDCDGNNDITLVVSLETFLLKTTPPKKG